MVKETVLKTLKVFGIELTANRVNQVGRGGERKELTWRAFGNLCMCRKNFTVKEGTVKKCIRNIFFWGTKPESLINSE